MAPDGSFEIEVESDRTPGTTLLIGLTQLGMAGITAADYVVRHVDTRQIGHIAPEELPAIAPFEQGEPRHHTRLYNTAEFDLTVLVGDLFIPVPAARSFTHSILEWCQAHGIEEIAILHGVPFPHGPDEHAVFTVSTTEYRERRLDQTDLQPLAGGFLDGVVGEIVTRSLDADSPPVGVYITPTHPPGPDVEAAILLLDAIQGVYGFSVDQEELRQLGEEMKQYYASLAERMQTLGEAEAALPGREYPEDRMYM